MSFTDHAPLGNRVKPIFNFLKSRIINRNSTLLEEKPVRGIEAVGGRHEQQEFMWITLCLANRFS